MVRLGGRKLSTGFDVKEVQGFFRRIDWDWGVLEIFEVAGYYAIDFILDGGLGKNGVFIIPDFRVES